MSDPTPVPLDEIERLADECEEIGDVLLLPSTTRALCEALRIAVEGLREIEVHKPPDHWPGGAFATAATTRGHAALALAAVRELVDLGGNDGP